MRRLFHFHKKYLLTLLLFLIFIWSLGSVQWGRDQFHSGGWHAIKQIASGAILPDVSPETLYLAVISTWRTLTYAAAGMSLALIFALVFGVLASGVLTKIKQTRWLQKTVFRSCLGFMRAIHELVWGWLFVVSFGLSPFAAIFAIAIPYGGMLGRILADMLNDVPKAPIISLTASGASRLQLVGYGYFPLVASHMLSYMMYRFECAIRSSAIMSFIGLGGLGYQIQISLDDLRYDQVWTFLYFLIGLIVVVDLWGQMLRRKIVS